MADDLPSRLGALLLSGTLHLAAGLLLFATATDGVPERGRQRADSGVVLVVELVPLEQMSGEASARPISPDEAQEPPSATPANTVAEGETEAMRQPRAAGQAASEPASAAETLGDAHDMATLPNAEVLSYRRRLEAHLARYRVYPPAARAAGHEGVVTLHFVMTAEGEVLNAWIETSSGFAQIDAEALSAIRRAQPLPAFPRGWPGKLDVSLPVTFTLG